MSPLACSTCGHLNLGGSKFCGECGSALPSVCPSCGHANPAGNKFCAECGTALAGPLPITASVSTVVGSVPASSPPEAQELEAVLPTAGAGSIDALEIEEKERRVVTLLFSDLVGSTELSERLDPEEVDEIVGSAQERLSSTVRRYGGHVVKLLGDGLLACFGAPVACEDDAERAVLAALDMQAATASLDVALPAGTPALQLRIGLTSGEVVAGAIGGVYDVTGDAANTAARLQGAAGSGQVLADEETMHMARRRIHFGARQDLTLKGKSGTVGGFLVLRPRERLAERWEVYGQPTPFIGRGKELAQLDELWQRARAGNGALVTLVGDAGTGKSRLVAEALERMGCGDDGHIVRGRCLSYSVGVSLSLVADVLRALFAVHDQQDGTSVRRGLERTLFSLLAPHGKEVAQPATDVLGTALGLAPGDSPIAQASPQIRRRATVRSLRLVLETLTAQAPALIVLEDVHWIDTASREVLEEILSDVSQRPLLVIATRRSEPAALGSPWQWRTEILLEPLAGDTAARLAQAVVGDRRLAPELERRLAERAEGNPFFLEELSRSLQDSASPIA